MPTGTVPIVAIFTPKRVKKYTYLLGEYLPLSVLTTGCYGI